MQKIHGGGKATQRYNSFYLCSWYTGLGMWMGHRKAHLSLQLVHRIGVHGEGQTSTFCPGSWYTGLGCVETHRQASSLSLYLGKCLSEYMNLCPLTSWKRNSTRTGGYYLCLSVSMPVFPPDCELPRADVSQPMLSIWCTRYKINKR